MASLPPGLTPTPIQPPIIQGAGDWSGYVGPGSANLSDQVRLSAMAQAGNASLAISQIPAVNDAMREFQKMYNAYVPAAVPIGAENMTLPEIQARYGEKAAEATQQYYTYNPSARAMDITREYNQNRYVITGSGISAPQSRVSSLIENPQSAAEIAYNVAIMGRVQNPYLAGKAVGEGFKPEWLGPIASRESSREITPIRDYVPTMPTGNIVGGGTLTAFTPFGNRAATAVENAKLGLGYDTGELAIYQTIPGRSIMNLVGGGGRAALQSGMFSFATEEGGGPNTPVVYTQESAGTQLSPKWSNPDLAKMVLANPEAFSRQGAEAYGGFVMPLDNRTLTPESKMSQYFNPYNLANFVNPEGANLGKSEAPGVSFPWMQSLISSPSIQYFTEKGATGIGFNVAVPEPKVAAPMPTAIPATAPSVPIAPQRDFLSQLNYDIGGFLGIRANAIEQTTTTTQVVPSSGELPYFGKLPYISDIISFISPQEYQTTTVATKQLPTVVSTVNETPYTVGQTTYYPSTTTTTGGEQKSESTILSPYASPLDLFLRGSMPVPGTKESVSISEIGGKFLESLPLIGIPAMAIRSETGAIENILPESKQYTSFIPYSRGYIEDTYKSTYESPSRSLASAALPVALVGLGSVLRMAGAGESLLAPTTNLGGIYQTGSKVASAAFLGLYATDISQRVFGVTPGEIEQKFLPSMERGKFQPSAGPSSAIQTLQEKFPGVEKARQQLNVVETQELIPMTLAFAGVSALAEPLVTKVQVRGLESKGITKISNPEISRYTTQEGFPTNPSIETSDLINSFNSGVITLKSPEALSKTIMAPYGEPLSRIPTGSQIGAAEGKTFIYTGAEYPFLKPGYVGESASELPSLFASQQGISYFTKAGASQAGGFGLTSDIFGIYKVPTMYRSSVTSGEFQQIPDNLLNMPNPIDTLTGKPFSINDPLNPRNIAIGDWIRTSAKPGIPIISQYGKSEWQYLIPSGSEVGMNKLSGYDIDSGSLIRQYDVDYTGLRSKQYKPPETINPITGDKVFQVAHGKFYAELPGVSSDIYKSQRIVPFLPSEISLIKSSVKTSTRESEISKASSVDSLVKSSGITSGIAKTRISTKSGSPSSLISDVISTLRSSPKESTSKITSPSKSIISKSSRSGESGISSSTGISKLSSLLSSMEYPSVSGSKDYGSKDYTTTTAPTKTTKTSENKTTTVVTTPTKTTTTITTTERPPSGIPLGGGAAGGGMGGVSAFRFRETFDVKTARKALLGNLRILPKPNKGKRK